MIRSQRESNRRNYIECKKCKRKIAYNRTELCTQCRSYNIEAYQIGKNNNDRVNQIIEDEQRLHD